MDVEHDRDGGTAGRGNLVRSPVSLARRIAPRAGLHVPATALIEIAVSFRGTSDIGRRDYWDKHAGKSGTMFRTMSMQQR